MSNSSPENLEVGKFIRAHRIARSTLSANDSGTKRRHVPHMRQSDLAERIGVSTVMISQIEQGRYPNLSHGLLTRIAKVLELPSQDEMYLLGLHKKRTEVQRGLEATPEWISDSVSNYGHPAMVVNPAYDVIAMNSASHAMLGSHAPLFSETSNVARAVFERKEMQAFFAQWDQIASGIVSGLRMGYAVHPDFRQHVSTITDQLSGVSEFFHTRWNMDNPLVESPIENQFMHPELGPINMILMTTSIVGSFHLTMLEFLPADEATREKLATYAHQD